jgi:DNA-binding response OmpR family regulator
VWIVNEKAKLRTEEQRVAAAQAKLRAEEQRILAAQAKLRAEEQRIVEAQAKLRAEEQSILDAQTKLRAEERKNADERAMLSTEEDTWLEKETKLRTWLRELNENGAVTPVPLIFEPDGKTIRWEGGEVKLGTKPCQFVKALYFAEEQQMTITDVEEKVWGESLDSTIQSTASQLRHTLAEKKCPYTVVNLINKQWTESEQPAINAPPSAPIRSAIAGFKLVMTFF